MANWEQFKQYVHSNLKVDKDDGDWMGLIFGLEDGRTQLITMAKSPAPSSDGDWVQITSPIGRVGSVDLEKAARVTCDLFCGGITILQDCVCVTHCLPIANLDANEFFEPLKRVYVSADLLEAALTGQDNFWFSRSSHKSRAHSRSLSGR